MDIEIFVHGVPKGRAFGARRKTAITLVISMVRATQML